MVARSHALLTHHAREIVARERARFVDTRTKVLGWHAAERAASVDTRALSACLRSETFRRHPGEAFGRTVLDDELIAELAAAVPLVLHGSSGVPDSALVSAVAAGMTEVNIATHLNVALTQAVRAALGDEGVSDPRATSAPVATP